LDRPFSGRGLRDARHLPVGSFGFSAATGQPAIIEGANSPILVTSLRKKPVDPMNQWIGLKEHLQESPHI